MIAGNLRGLLRGVVLSAALAPLAADASAAPRPAARVVEAQAGAGGFDVSGRLLPPEGLQIAGGTIALVPAGAAAGSAPADAVLAPDGSFSFGHVPAGTYEIRARAALDPGGQTHFATFRLRVEAGRIQGIVMPLLPAAAVSGTVVFDAPGPGPAVVRVIAPAADAVDEVPPGAAVSPAGGFSVAGLPAGRRLIRLDGLPAAWVLARVESAGRDVTDTGLDISPGQRIGGVRITAAPAATEVSGRIAQSSGTVTGVLVLVIPLSEQFWHPWSRRLAVVEPDAAGRFTIRGLPEGEYRAVAVSGLEPDEAYAPEMLRRLGDAGLPLTLAGAGPHVIEVPLMPAAREERASPR